MQKTADFDFHGKNVDGTLITGMIPLAQRSPEG